MCPVSYGLGAKFNETHWQLYREAIDYITITKGAYAILDPHNYMRYNDPSQQPMTGSVIGNSSDPKAATTAQFGEFWGELGRRFANNTKVIFGLMNEPHDMPTELVLANDQAAVDAIRRAGARNLILAPGNSWTGGHSWTQGGSEANSEWMYKLNDPIDNTAFDIHEYLDVDFSGSHSACVSDPIANLANLTSWLREHRLKALVSEFGGANNTGCYTMIAELINYLGANDEYIGWSAWAAGEFLLSLPSFSASLSPWCLLSPRDKFADEMLPPKTTGPLWGTYSPCCEDGGQDGSLEPGSVSSNGSPGMYITVWLAAIQPLLPSRLQWNGPASIHGGPLTSKGNSTKGGL